MLLRLDKVMSNDVKFSVGCFKDRFQVIITFLECSLFDVMNVDIPSKCLERR